MAGFRWTRARVAGAVGGAVLAGGVVLAGGIASAQSPSPSPSASPGSRPGGRGNINAKIGDFAAKLAQALGIPQARVEAALQQLRDQKRNGQGASSHQNRLAGAAQRLGVTEQQLQDAIRAATQAQVGQTPPGQGQPRGGPRMGIGHPNSDAFFNAVAQQLGGGRTGAQVRDAIEAGRQQMPRPDRSQIEARKAEFDQSFAALLGVTPDQLREALRGIGGPMGHRGR